MAAKLYTTEYLCDTVLFNFTVQCFFPVILFIISCFISFFYRKQKLVPFGSLCKKDRRLAKHLSNYFLDHWKHLIYTFSGQALQHISLYSPKQKKNFAYEEFNRHRMRNQLVIWTYTFHIQIWFITHTHAHKLIIQNSRQGNKIISW